MTKQNMITITLVGSNQLLREGIKQIIKTDPLLNVVAESQSISEASELLKKHQSDILLLDFNVNSIASLNTLKQLCKSTKETKIVLIVNTNEGSAILDALKFNIKGIFTKDMDEATFIKGIKKVYFNKYWIHPDFSHLLLDKYYTALEKDTFQMPLDIFTLRECEVLELLAQGKTNLEITNILHIAESTVKKHIMNIMVKTGVNDRTNVVILAIKNNWVRLDKINDKVIKRFPEHYNVQV